MKKLNLLSWIPVVLMLVGLSLMSCQKNNDEVINDTITPLTDAERTTLLFMHEEEKLARDVYNYFYDKHDLNIFKNIANSEQTHMNYVLNAMEDYGLESSANSEAGVFNNPDLQTLYDNLIEQGNASLIDALTVGATIEDVDIRDLNLAIAETNKVDLSTMYSKLLCGSGNHMRAFTGQLDALDAIYSPQFISQELFDEILEGEQGHCG